MKVAGPHQHQGGSHVQYSHFPAPPRGLTSSTFSVFPAGTSNSPVSTSRSQAPPPTDPQGPHRPAPAPTHPPAAASAAHSLFDALAGAFTRPTFLRFLVLALASLLTIGRRTVCNLLRTLGALAPGHPSSYHRIFSQRRWSSWRLAHGLAGWVFDHLVPEGPVFLAGDDTVDGHKGAKVFGKGCHRDPVRSTHSFTVFRWGHKWVVLTVLVRFPGRGGSGRCQCW